MQANGKFCRGNNTARDNGGQSHSICILRIAFLSTQRERERERERPAVEKAKVLVFLYRGWEISCKYLDVEMRICSGRKERKGKNINTPSRSAVCFALLCDVGVTRSDEEADGVLRGLFWFNLGVSLGATINIVLRVLALQ